MFLLFVSVAMVLTPLATSGRQVAANVALRDYPETVRQILIIDCDVHQGNGNAVLFRSKPAVFTFSMHCRANYFSEKEVGAFSRSTMNRMNSTGSVRFDACFTALASAWPLSLYGLAVGNRGLNIGKGANYGCVVHACWANCQSSGSRGWPFIFPLYHAAGSRASIRLRHPHGVRRLDSGPCSAARPVIRSSMGEAKDRFVSSMTETTAFQHSRNPYVFPMPVIWQCEGHRCSKFCVGSGSQPQRSPPWSFATTPIPWCAFTPIPIPPPTIVSESTSTPTFASCEQESDVDIEVDEGTGDDEYLSLLSERLPVLVDQVRPDLIFYQVGWRCVDGTDAGGHTTHRRKMQEAKTRRVVSLTFFRKSPFGLWRLLLLELSLQSAPNTI